MNSNFIIFMCDIIMFLNYSSFKRAKQFWNFAFKHKMSYFDCVQNAYIMTAPQQYKYK